MRGARTPAFLLAQVGALAAEGFGRRVEALGLSRQEVGVLRALASSPGTSQQVLADRLKVVPSRLVVLVDGLESRGLVERRDHPDDRRVYALYLTAKGDRTMLDIAKIGRAHNEALCAALSETERETLVDLLSRIAEEQGLVEGVHPGLAKEPRRKS